MKRLLAEIQACKICRSELPFEPNPIVSAKKNSKIVIIGQAPGTKVNETGIPWDDPSGKQLRAWLNVGTNVFYDSSNFALIPMGFCYPGNGKGGDLPPRPECAPQWHDLLLNKMPNVEMILLIGMYSQKYYLKNDVKKNLTETVKYYKDYLPQFFPLPHPSPRNRFWLTKNPWFDKDIVPLLQQKVKKILFQI